MRWVTCRRPNQPDTAGLVIDDEIRLLAAGTRLIDLIGDPDQLSEAGQEATTAPADVVAYDGANLAPPIQPVQMRDFLTFLDHLRAIQSGLTGNDELHPVWGMIPPFYFTNITGVVGPYDPVKVSPGTEWFDFELEVGAVIGTPGTNLHPDEAEAHIAGFTVFCDWSARDLQLREMGGNLGPAKGKDTATTLGPMLVTPDELEPFRQGNSYHLEMTAHIGGEAISAGFMDQMEWSWGELLAFASRGTTLQTGEVIGSGTVPTGCLMEHYATNPEGFRGWLQPGDELRLTVDQLGSTRQKVEPPLPLHPLRTGF